MLELEPMCYFEGTAARAAGVGAGVKEIRERRLTPRFLAWLPGKMECSLSATNSSLRGTGGDTNQTCYSTNSKTYQMN